MFAEHIHTGITKHAKLDKAYLVVKRLKNEEYSYCIHAHATEASKKIVEMGGDFPLEEFLHIALSDSIHPLSIGIHNYDVERDKEIFANKVRLGLPVWFDVTPMKVHH